MASYLEEPVDRLPFASAEKARRYDTDRFHGAVGLNWYRCDPGLQARMRRHLGAEGLAWAEPHLDAAGELIGGPIAERAVETDRNPPRLEKYDRWGHDISQVHMPASFEASKRDLLELSLTGPRMRREAEQAGVPQRPLTAAWSYLLNQAEIGMMCALGTGTDMVEVSVEQFAPDDVKERVRALSRDGSMVGETAQLFTERTGGADLAALETTATRDGDAWRLNGFKWFVSNVNGAAFIVLAKPEGAPDATRGVAPFLVLWERRDGSRNGIRIRRLKDKLGTKAVASAEVELVDAEAFLLAPSVGGGSGGSSSDEGTHDGRGLGRMMAMTNGARLGIAMMGLGCARRALVESLCYASAREAFGAPLTEQPLMQRKLAELIVETEAALELCLDGYLNPLRIGAPLIKLRAARLGIAAASDAIEIHGGNGYIETWPVARILRDAQVNTVWEGPDNILCLDVRRAIVREQAHTALIERLRRACDAGPAGDPDTVELVRDRVDLCESAVEAWSELPEPTAEARLWELSNLLVDTYAATLLVEHAGWEESELGSDRGSLVARLYARDHIVARDPVDRVTGRAEELERFKDLADGALADPRVTGGP